MKLTSIHRFRDTWRRSGSRPVRGTLSWLVVAAALPAGPVLAQSDSVLEEIVVTGYRGSLLNSTNAKRNSIGFTDEIFADDIGKLPSQNLAESLNRIPGVKIQRDHTGEGQQISVRGLGPSFTKIALNGNNIAVAADGNLTGTNSNREVDLDIFPPELFSSLVVSKTPLASQLEGGTSGYVNLRTLRPFDYEAGQHLLMSAEGAYTEINDEISPRLSAIYSNTFNDRFGVLVGVVASRRDYRVDGYETVGFSDGCIADFTDPPANTNSNCDASGAWLGRNHFMYQPYATADYVAAHPELGLAAGDPIDPLATSGLTRDQLDRGIIPYLGRGMFTIGDRDATSALASFQYRPNESMDFAFDVLYAETDREFDRVEAMSWGRRNWIHLGAGWVPENLTVNSDQVVTSGTLYNAHAWVGQRAYDEDFDFTAYMPSFAWDISDTLHLDLSASYTESSFRRDEPYFLFLSPGTTLQYSGLGDVPTFDFALDISRPDIGWVWNDVQGDQIRFQRNLRDTETLGFHADFALGEEPERTGVVFGVAYDEASRDLTFYNGDIDVLKEEFFFPSDAYANIENYLVASPVSDLGDVFDNSVGYSGIAMLDADRFMEAINYHDFVPTSAGTGDQFGQGVGGIEEEMLGLYVAANAEAELLGQVLRMNAGVRWVETDQTLTSLAGDGTAVTETKYSKFLPSFNAVYDLSESLKLRASASRTMTRANPGEMYPNSVWTSSGIDTARAGNPNLEPFESINFDIGGEYYYGTLGYVSLIYFEKEITGFTRNDTIDVLFQDLPAFGLDTSNISDSQQDALDACGGPSLCTVQLSTRTNVQGAATLRGFEGIWVMPLDFLVEGLGFNASVTKINQSADDEASIITGISDWTYNWTGYFENELVQARVTYYHQDGAIASGFQGYDGTGGFPARRIRSDDRAQVDFSVGLNLPNLGWLGDGTALTLTLDGYNITNEPVRNLFEHSDLTYDIFYPGATYTLGVRAAFE